MRGKFRHIIFDTELAEIGPVSQMMSKKFTLHIYMSDTFIEGLGREEVKNKLQDVRTRDIYVSILNDMRYKPKV